ncbi:MAG TPA: hypothetical protein DIT04_07155 [Dysgonomonas sp.]|nr:hypothetical protein [Dysgonomonas sp.]
MKTRIFILASLLALSYLNMHAQVTIGSGEAPHEKALLDLKEGNGTNKDESSKGFFLPRVKLASTADFFGTNDHQEGTIVYNRNTSEKTVPAAERVSPGFYYNNGTKWEKLALGYTNWFHMPSIPIKTSENKTGQTIDLYDKYKAQFSAASGNFVKSTDAPATIPYFPSATDLYYYVTDYDPDVFSNITIDNDGVMTYDVKAAATDYTFMNIIFVLK